MPDWTPIERRRIARFLAALEDTERLEIEGRRLASSVAANTAALADSRAGLLEELGELDTLLRGRYGRYSPAVARHGLRPLRKPPGRPRRRRT